jgi:Uma2 family endonuclease
MTADAHADTLVGHAGPWTEADYLALPESRSRIELLDGALLVSPAPAGPHQRMARRLSFALEAAAPAGLEILDAINVRVGPGRILIPDIVVLRETGLDKTVYEAADALMVVEIASPSRPGIDRITKPAAYGRAGIPYYLLVESNGDAMIATAYVLTPGGVYGEAARSDARAVLSLQQPFPVSIDLDDMRRARIGGVQE